MKKIFFGLAVCLCVLAASHARAQNQHVLDTGDPAERVCNPKSYSDLGNGIVRDNVTGLEWVQDGNLMATRDPSFDNDGTAGDGRVDWQHALDYIALLNNQEYLGYSDWRLPTVEELSSLVDAGRINPAIDPVFGTVAFFYWSSTTLASYTGYAWNVSFYDGYVLNYNKTIFIYVRAVRSGQYGSLDTLVINGDGTVIDTNTALMWQQCNYGQTWSGTACIGSAAGRTWTQAVAYVQGLNDTNYLGYGDWRLPTINELQSLVDYSRDKPTTTFPNTASSNYWSSTADAVSTGNAWYVNFIFGPVSLYIKSNSLYVRAVRGGPCWSFGDWCISDSDCYDDVFCNGLEQCEAGECVPGEPPFCPSDAPMCDEDYTGCVECLTNADCAGDGLFCNGAEKCLEGTCVAGTVECAEGEICDETLDTCVAAPECTADVDCDDTLFCTGVESCAAGVCEPGTNPCAGGKICDDDGDRCVECLNDSQCVASERCADNVCIVRCTLAVEYKPPVAAKLKNDKKVSLKITGGEGFDPSGDIDLGQFQAVKPKVNAKKGSVKVKAVVPAGTAPGTYPISVGDCIGEIKIL